MISSRVSIIMPLKNASQWVEETIQSILKQTHEDWELIVVDDHSEDHSIEIVSNYVHQDNRIQLFKNASKGIIPALQLAFEKASGTYITRMDADDIMPVNRLKLMVEQLQNLPDKAIVTGKVKYFSDTAVSPGYLKYEQWLNERVEQQDFYKHIYRECIVASPNWMGRTDEFRQDDLFTQLVYPEDYDLCFRWNQLNYAIYGIDEVTLLWREHPLRTSRNSIIYQQKSFFELKLNWFIEQFSTAKSIGIVGLGQKGKLCAQQLNNSNVLFNLYDLNPEKYVQNEWNKVVQSPNNLTDEIILIARYPEDLSAITQYIENQGYEIGKNAFWV